MNIHDLYEYGTEVDLLDLRGRFAFRTENSASFDLIGRGQDGELLIGWVDMHHPCDGFIRAKVRVIVPVEHHKFEWMRDFIQRLFTALGIPADETFEADFVGSEHQIRYEAYLGLMPDRGGEPGGDQSRWRCRAHFFAAAAEAMRRILVDQARRKHSVRRGGGRQRLPLDEALRELEAEEPVKAQLVKLRFFAGASLEDAARMLDISPATAKRYWVYARSWLYGRLHGP